MSTLLVRQIACPACGAPQQVVDCDSINVDRFPGARQALLDGELMRARCGCGHEVVLEHPLLYIDLEGRLIAAVLPQGERGRARAREVAGQLEAALPGALAEMAPPEPVLRACAAARRRVVFGLEELREKVVCGLAVIDDRALEAMKRALLLSRPALTGLGVRLSLQAADGEALWLAPLGLPGGAWVPGGDADETAAPESGGRALIRVARSIYQGFADDLERLAHLRPELPELHDGLYVSLDGAP